MTRWVYRRWSQIWGVIPPRLVARLKDRGRRIVRVISVVLLLSALICGVATVVVLLWPRDNTFSVTAVTETASIVIDDDMGVTARLPLARVLSRGDHAFPLASLEITRGARITLTRKREGDLFIWIDWEEGAPGSARLISQEGSPMGLSSGESLRIALDRQPPDDSKVPIPDVVTLAFRGALRLGEDPRPHVQDTLLSGRVLIVERQPLLGHRFVVSEATLDPGDVAAWQTKSRAAATVAGFVHVGAGPALQIIAHGAADHVLVDRFGAKPYEIRPSAWNRIQRDPVVANLMIVVTALAALVSIYELVMRPVRGGQGGTP